MLHGISYMLQQLHAVKGVYLKDRSRGRGEVTIITLRAGARLIMVILGVLYQTPHCGADINSTDFYNLVNVSQNFTM